jgi:hypothetical protein
MKTEKDLLAADEVTAEQLTDDAKIDAAARDILERFKPAFLELAK